MIINGVVFAVSSGENRPTENAVLYALDGATGNVLWDSGKSITSFVHGGGLSGGAGQLYLETSDQTLYAFGFPVEH
jgi:outer membrane protein assembly factor BamB